MPQIKSVKSTTVTATGAAQRVLGPNTRRVALIISSSSNSLGAIRFGEAPASANDGIMCTASAGPAVLTYEQLGPVIKSSVGFFGVGAILWNFTEVLEASDTVDEIIGS